MRRERSIGRRPNRVANSVARERSGSRIRRLTLAMMRIASFLPTPAASMPWKEAMPRTTNSVTSRAPKVSSRGCEDKSSRCFRVASTASGRNCFRSIRFDNSSPHSFRKRRLKSWLSIHLSPHPENPGPGARIRVGLYIAWERAGKSRSDADLPAVQAVSDLTDAPEARLQTEPFPEARILLGEEARGGKRTALTRWRQRPPALAAIQKTPSAEPSPRGGACLPAASGAPSAVGISSEGRSRCEARRRGAAIRRRNSSPSAHTA